MLAQHAAAQRRGHTQQQEAQQAQQQGGQQAPQQKQAQQQPPQQQPPGPAAGVMMRGLVALGLEAVQAQQVPFLSDGMCNGVRWGLVVGRQRLLAADQVRCSQCRCPGPAVSVAPPACRRWCWVWQLASERSRSVCFFFPTHPPTRALVCIVQSGYVYVFELPPAATDIASSSSGGGSNGAAGDDGSLQPEQLLCAGLGQPSQFWQMRPVSGGGRAATPQACHGASGVCSGRSVLFHGGLEYCSAEGSYCVIPHMPNCRSTFSVPPSMLWGPA
jgi:hypothetical protein